MSTQVPPLHQGVWTEPTKFDQLRSKTDLQLVQVINAELSLGIRYAHQALKSADMWAIAEECNHRAKRAYTKLSRLIPVVSEITEDERSRVESRLEYLHGMLEALSAIGSTPSPIMKSPLLPAPFGKHAVALRVLPKKIGFERNGH